MTIKQRLSIGLLACAALLLSGCVASPWAQRDAANSFTRDWERVGFTTERQIEILKGFGCSDVHIEDPKTFKERVVGDNCSVLGEMIPRMRVTSFPVTVAFSGGPNKPTRWCVNSNEPDPPRDHDVGQEIMARFQQRLPELSEMVFQGRADGRLKGVGIAKKDHLCSFALKPVFKN